MASVGKPVTRRRSLIVTGARRAPDVQEKSFEALER